MLDPNANDFFKILRANDRIEPMKEYQEKLHPILHELLAGGAMTMNEEAIAISVSEIWQLVALQRLRHHYEAPLQGTGLRLDISLLPSSSEPEDYSNAQAI